MEVSSWSTLMETAKKSVLMESQPKCATTMGTSRRPWQVGWSSTFIRRRILGIWLIPMEKKFCNFKSTNISFSDFFFFRFLFKILLYIFTVGKKKFVTPMARCKSLLPMVQSRGSTLMEQKTSISPTAPKPLLKQTESGLWFCRTAKKKFTPTLARYYLKIFNLRKLLKLWFLQTREYPDGTIKILYDDGRCETRYTSGRIRIKDGDGKLLQDSANNSNAKSMPIKV